MAKVSVGVGDKVKYTFSSVGYSTGRLNPSMGEL